MTLNSYVLQWLASAANNFSDRIRHLLNRIDDDGGGAVNLLELNAVESSVSYLGKAKKTAKTVKTVKNVYDSMARMSPPPKPRPGSLKAMDPNSNRAFELWKSVKDDIKKATDRAIHYRAHFLPTLNNALTCGNTLLGIQALHDLVASYSSAFEQPQSGSPSRPCAN